MDLDEVWGQKKAFQKEKKTSRRLLRKPEIRATWNIMDAIRKATIKASAERPAKSKTEYQK
jgi:hypothetical protein